MGVGLKVADDQTRRPDDTPIDDRDEAGWDAAAVSTCLKASLTVRDRQMRGDRRPLSMVPASQLRNGINMIGQVIDLEGHAVTGQFESASVRTDTTTLAAFRFAPNHIIRENSTRWPILS